MLFVSRTVPLLGILNAGQQTLDGRVHVAPGGGEGADVGFGIGESHLIELRKLVAVQDGGIDYTTTYNGTKILHSSTSEHSYSQRPFLRDELRHVIVVEGFSAG